jgi:eukaryotic-like serine/threonine-protein kinase
MGDRNARGVSMLKDVTLSERYGLVWHIASGGMASVWCAEDRALGRRVAIKLLAERFARDESAVRRFKREARTAAQLSGHVNVVTIYDVGETTPAEPTDAAQAFIVMEYLPGGSVADALRLRSVTPTEAVRWLREAASALDYAHRHGVLHRDIKPANLLLDRDRVVHVADFGIAQLSTDDALTVDGQVLGTAAYLAPERAVGRAATDASDRYSLAVAAFELLTGERPFGAERFAAQARQHIDAPPPPASERKPQLPPALDAVLARGMAKRPEQRWPSARAFADAVDAALAETVVRASPGRPVRRHREQRTPRRAIAIAALAAAALAVGIALGASHSPSSKPHGSASRAQRITRHAAATPAPAKRRPKPAGPQSKPKPKPQTTPAQVSATSAAATTPPPTADTLEARGHGLMESGEYGAAIPVIRQALAAAPPTSLTYAYALYDLGRSLRLAGDPRAAVTVLYQRLQIPNQTGVVRSELQEALRELGKQAQTQGAKPRHGGAEPGQGGAKPRHGGAKPGHGGAKPRHGGGAPAAQGGSGDSGGVPGAPGNNSGD